MSVNLWINFLHAPRQLKLWRLFSKMGDSFSFCVFGCGGNYWFQKCTPWRKKLGWFLDLKFAVTESMWMHVVPDGAWLKGCRCAGAGWVVWTAEGELNEEWSWSLGIIHITRSVFVFGCGVLNTVFSVLMYLRSPWFLFRILQKRHVSEYRLLPLFADIMLLK